MTKEEAIYRLTWVKDVSEMIGMVPIGTESRKAIDAAISALREPKSDGVTIKLADNGMCAIVRKVKGRYVIDTGRVEKWPEEDE